MVIWFTTLFEILHHDNKGLKPECDTRALWKTNIIKEVTEAARWTLTITDSIVYTFAIVTKVVSVKK